MEKEKIDNYIDGCIAISTLSAVQCMRAFFDKTARKEFSDESKAFIIFGFDINETGEARGTIWREFYIKDYRTLTDDELFINFRDFFESIRLPFVCKVKEVTLKKRSEAINLVQNVNKRKKTVSYLEDPDGRAEEVVISTRDAEDIMFQTRALIQLQANCDVSVNKGDVV
jgi:hypothetical protein